MNFEKDYFEKLGIEITYLGYDRHDYSKANSPIDVESVARDYYEAKEKGFVGETEFDLERVANCIIAMYESEQIRTLNFKGGIMIGLSFAERMYNTYWELEYSEVDTENTRKARKLLLNRLENCDHSELTEEECEIIAYAYADVEYGIDVEQR